MVICSQCGKNIAVCFPASADGGGTQGEGLCLITQGLEREDTGYLKRMETRRGCLLRGTDLPENTRERNIKYAP